MERDPFFLGTPAIVGQGKIYQKLIIGSDCIIGNSTYFDLESTIRIGNRTTIGPQVMILTGTHEIGNEYNRLGQLLGKPVCIGDGVWLGARTIILPGVNIGESSVVAAGSVVTKDIPPNTLAAGVPAVVKRNLV